MVWLVGILQWKNFDNVFGCFERLLACDRRMDRQTEISAIKWQKSVSKGPFIATQLNSTRRRVELRRRSVYSDANLLRADWLYAATGSVALPIVGDSRVASVRVSIVTQVELSCIGEVSIATRWCNSTRRQVELCHYKRALRGQKWSTEVLSWPSFCWPLKTSPQKGGKLVLRLSSIIERTFTPISRTVAEIFGAIQKK